MPTEAELRRVSVEGILDLRHAVLRPGRPPETARFDGDEDSGTRHYGLHREGTCVACLTLLCSVHRDQPAWQLRGMAVAAGLQGQGLGTALLRGVEAELVAEGGALLWCNAREGARPFYERSGWRVCSQRFEVAGIGPHWRMERDLRAAP